jgi:hypothetical protein
VKISRSSSSPLAPLALAAAGRDFQPAIGGDVDGVERLVRRGQASE